MNILIRLLISAVAVLLTAYILPGATVADFGSALVVAIVLGILNAIVKPILVVLTLPVTVITLGLFMFVINALIVMLAGSLVPGFQVDGFLWALIFSLIVSVINSFLMNLVDGDKK